MSGHAAFHRLTVWGFSLAGCLLAGAIVFTVQADEDDVPAIPDSVLADAASTNEELPPLPFADDAGDVTPPAGDDVPPPMPELAESEAETPPEGGVSPVAGEDAPPPMPEMTEEATAPPATEPAPPAAGSAPKAAEPAPLSPADAEPPRSPEPAATAPGDELPDAFAPRAEDEQPEFGGDFGLKPISSIQINITATRGELPADHASPRFSNEVTDLTWPAIHRPWVTTAYCWEAPSSRHWNLLFEQTNLERYGWNYGCLQPVVSAAQFYGTIPLIPYKIGVHGFTTPIYTLGHYRPGNCVPYQWHYLPWSWKAAALEAGAVTGAIYAVP